MSIYKDSKIYKLVDNTNGDVFYGSTVLKLLCRRMAKMKHDYITYLNGNRGYSTLFKIIANGNYDIILVENFSCNSKDELKAQLAKHIKENECINKIIPLRTKKEYAKEHKKIVDCECGRKVSSKYMNRHLKTLIHNSNI